MINIGSIIVPSPIHFPYTLKQHYCENHLSDDFRIMESVIKNCGNSIYPKAFDDVIINGNRMSRYNMFIMKWADFDSYCSWLFSVLREIENKTNITHYNSVQKRIYGYMSERLFNVWLKANKKVTIELPVIMISDTEKNKRNPFLWNLRDMIWDTTNAFNRLSRLLLK